MNDLKSADGYPNPQPPSKRRKVDHLNLAPGPEFFTLGDPNNTLATFSAPFTPEPSPELDDIEMDTQITHTSLFASSNSTDEVVQLVCPCGYLHGEGEHNDLSAVGLSSTPLLRGPD